MPPTWNQLEAALAMKSRECQALRESLGIVDFHPWGQRLVFEKCDLDLGAALHPTVTITASGELVLELG